MSEKVKAAPKTRTESLPRLPEGVTVPSGYVPAYYRKRASLAVLRALDNSGYLVLEVQTGAIHKAATTRETSKLMAQIGRDIRTAREALKGEKSPVAADSVVESKEA
jgi:hypothetical protein